MFVSLSKTTLFLACFAEILLAAVKGTLYVDAISCRIACPIGKRDWARFSRSYYRVVIGQEMFRREKQFESGNCDNLTRQTDLIPLKGKETFGVNVISTIFFFNEGGKSVKNLSV